MGVERVAAISPVSVFTSADLIFVPPRSIPMKCFLSGISSVNAFVSYVIAAMLLPNRRPDGKIFKVCALAYIGRSLVESAPSSQQRRARRAAKAIDRLLTRGTEQLRRSDLNRGAHQYSRERWRLPILRKVATAPVPYRRRHNLVSSDLRKTTTEARHNMNLTLRLQLSLMMFVQFFVWGAWYVTGPNYLSTIGFTATDFG